MSLCAMRPPTGRRALKAIFGVVHLLTAPNANSVGQDASQPALTRLTKVLFTCQSAKKPRPGALKDP